MTLTRGAALLALLALSSQAAPASAPARQEQPAPGEEGPDPANEVEHYSRALQLDAAQKKKALAVLKEKRGVFGELARLRREFSAAAQGLQSKIGELNKEFASEIARMEAVQAAAKDKIRALLTPDQKKRFDDMEKERERYEKEFRRIQDEKSKRDGEAGGAPPERRP